MARWAFLALIAACVTTVASLWGLIYIRNTLVLNRRAVEANAKQTEFTRLAYLADNRPWLEFVIYPDGNVTQRKNRITLPFHIKIKNGGRSPAENAVPRWRYIQTDSIYPTIEVEKFIRDTSPSLNYIGGSTYFPGRFRISTVHYQSEVDISKSIVPGYFIFGFFYFSSDRSVIYHTIDMFRLHDDIPGERVTFALELIDSGRSVR
jgi:hypothetical protein